MVGPTLILISLFLIIFGISYLFFATRNKERLALIEKGADASIFKQLKTEGALPFWKILVLNISLLLMGVGLGIIIGGISRKIFDLDGDIAISGCIFLMAGIGLLVGFYLTKRLEK